MSLDQPSEYFVHLIAWTYFLVNTSRVLFYVPQIRSLWRLRGLNAHVAAKAVSSFTWFAFALSHFTTLIYAHIVLNDWMLAIVSFLNLLFSGVIYFVAIYKQTSAIERARISRKMKFRKVSRSTRVAFRRGTAA